jgi:Zn-dependent peptidase ImmA (M78 family)/transcriptional regulator with XRE-family HTH domain
MKSFEVNANPEIIKYYMGNYNISSGELAKKIGENENTINEIINGHKKLRYTQLQKLAKMVKKDPLVFLMEKPLEDKPLSNVFRKLKDSHKLPYKIIIEINRMKELQEIARELYSNLGKSLESDINEYPITQPAAEVATIERKKFYSHFEQKSWKSPYIAFDKWREAFGNMNILTMQMPVDTQYFRGFSLINSIPYLLVVSSKDDINARSFTLLHEYAHLLLRHIETGENDNSVEKWCDEFASNFLISDDIINDNWSNPDNVEKFVQTISSQYKVSKSMLYYRLKSMGKISDTLYNEYYNKYKDMENSLNKPGGGNFYKNEKSKYGTSFLLAVFENYNRGYITIDSALNYLSMKYSTFIKLEEQL